MSYQMTGPEDDPTSPWDYLKFGLGAMAPDNAGPFLRDNLGLGLSSPAPAPAPAPVQDGIAGWAASPDQGGLWVRGQSDPAPAGSGMNWVDALKGIGGALEGFSAGFHGRTPLFVKMQELEQQQQLHRDTLAQQQQARRDTIKQQMAQLEEQKKQHTLGLFKDFMTKPGLTDSQREELIKPLADKDPMIRAAVEGIGKKRIGKLQYYADRYPDEIGQLVQDWQGGKLGPADIDQQFSAFDERDKLTAKHRVMSARYAQLSQIMEQSLQSGEPVDPALVEEFSGLQAEQAKAREQLESLRLSNESKRNKINSPATDMKVNDLIGNERTRDVLTAQGYNPLDMAQRAIAGDKTAQGLLQKARAQADTELGSLAEKQSLGRGLGTGDVPVGTEANKYTKLLPDGTSQAVADPMMGKTEAGKQGYRDTAAFKANLEQADKARTALRSLKQLESYAKEIITAQGPVQIIEQAGKLSIQGITKGGVPTKIKAPNGKFMTVGEVAKLYDDLSDNLADQLAKGGGIVGTLTERDTQKNLRGLASKYDTANIVSEKFGRFGKLFGSNILQEYERAYGRDGVPESLRMRLRKGDTPPDSRIDGKAFLHQQEKFYKEQGYGEKEIRDLLIRDFKEFEHGS